MRYVYAPAFELTSWWDPDLGLEGWFDGGFAADLAGPPDGVYAVLSDGAATNGNNNTAPRLTVPDGVVTGDVLVVAIALNNTDVITARPSTAANQSDADQGAAAAEIYTIVVDGTTVTAGTILAWTLSATRRWITMCQAYGGVDTSNPLESTTLVSTAASGAVTSPSGTQSGYLVEVLTHKAGGTATTSWTAPAGMTSRVQAAASAAFGPSGLIADNNTNPHASGTYGGNTYTPDQTGTIVLTFGVGLKALSEPPATPVEAWGWIPIF